MSKFKTVAIVSVLALIPILMATRPAPPPASKGLTGVQEFFTSGTFTVPDGITHVMVTMWGGGGGAGAGATTSTGGIYNGGGGGGAAYTKTVVPVTAGLTYTITVGSGGIAGVNAGENGATGGDSQFALGNTLLAFAGGGQGGTAATPSATGVGGSGGQADGTAQISHAGNAWTPADFLAYSYSVNLTPYANYSTGCYFSSHDVPFSSSIGTGGNYAVGGCQNGNPGYVLLTF